MTSSHTFSLHGGASPHNPLAAAQERVGWGMRNVNLKPWGLMTPARLQNWVFISQFLPRFRFVLLGSLASRGKIRWQSALQPKHLPWKGAQTSA